MNTCAYCGAGIDGAYCPNCQVIRERLYQIESILVIASADLVHDKKTQNSFKHLHELVMGEIIKIKKERESRIGA